MTAGQRFVESFGNPPWAGASVAPSVAVPLTVDPAWPDVSRRGPVEVDLGAFRVGFDPWVRLRVRTGRRLMGDGSLRPRPVTHPVASRRSGPPGHESVVTWLILPVVICLSQRLSHACLSISNCTAKLRMAH